MKGVLVESSEPRFVKYIFVCENHREKDACCGAGGERVREALKDLVKRKGLSGRIRVSRSGCLDVCSEGPNVLLMPDNLWFKHVTAQDAEAIVAQAEKGIS